jgi:hypothetical protein
MIKPTTLAVAKSMDSKPKGRKNTDRPSAKSKNRMRSKSTVRAETKAPDYLRDFHKKCIVDFDVDWITQQLICSPKLPKWYRTILTSMLVSWSVCSSNKQIRKSFAWHKINLNIHERIVKARADTGGSYYQTGIVSFILSADRYQLLYRPLGGFASKSHYSFKEIRKLTAENALHARACMPLIDIQTFRFQQSEQDFVDLKKTQNQAVCQLHKLHEIYSSKSKRDDAGGVDRQNMFSTTSSYYREAISPKNFEKHWKDIKQSAAFVAALYCMSSKIKRKTTSPDINHEMPIYLNALECIVRGKFDRLDYSSMVFQLELLSRAKFFMAVLNSDAPGSTTVRMFDAFQQTNCKIEIFSETALRSTLQNYKT